MSTPADLVQHDDTAGRRGPSLLSRAAVAFGVGLVAVAALVFAGFVNFVARVPVGEQATPAASDGIVAMTGGAERLSDALILLASGRGKRLLISGVNAETSERALSRAQPDYAAFARCCVDLGRRALNTAGNAVETRRWAESHGFRSLIVVTSGYHMPRTMLELAREMPNAELIPYAVTDRSGAPWWHDWPTARLLVGEYVKFVAALVRVRLAPRLARTETAEGRTAGPGDRS